MVLQGIDVSRYQGTINWQKVKSAGKQFAILKATAKNNSIEDKFEENCDGCRDNNIPVGVYRYVYAASPEKARSEAEALVSVLAGKKITCGVWLDMEDSGLQGLSSAKLEEIIKTEAQILKKAGFKVGIYCNKNWYENILDGKSLSSTYPFWIARYPNNDTGIYNENSSLNPKSYAVIWQYSSKGRVNGINGNVDLDAAFSDLTSLMDAGNKTTGEEKADAVSESEPAQSFSKTYAKRYITKANLNLRRGAGTDKTIILTIPKGNSVVCYGYYTKKGNTTWLYVQYGNIIGYCSLAYLK